MGFLAVLGAFFRIRASRFQGFGFLLSAPAVQDFGLQAVGTAALVSSLVQFEGLRFRDLGVKVVPF